MWYLFSVNILLTCAKSNLMNTNNFTVAAGAAGLAPMPCYVTCFFALLFLSSGLIHYEKC